MTNVEKEASAITRGKGMLFNPGLDRGNPSLKPFFLELVALQSQCVGEQDNYSDNKPYRQRLRPHERISINLVVQPRCRSRKEYLRGLNTDMIEENRIALLLIKDRKTRQWNYGLALA